MTFRLSANELASFVSLALVCVHAQAVFGSGDDGPVVLTLAVCAGVVALLLPRASAVLVLLAGALALGGQLGGSQAIPAGAALPHDAFHLACTAPGHAWLLVLLCRTVFSLCLHGFPIICENPDFLCTNPLLHPFHHMSAK